MLNLDGLYDKSSRRCRHVGKRLIRFAYRRLDPSVRLSIVYGHRGVGKTTLLLQYLKYELGESPEHLYVSLDSLYFNTASLYEVGETFVKLGGKVLLLDEVHKYPNWSAEVKSLYDDFPELSLVLTGSSALNLHAGNADLSRRARRIHLPVLSYREYLHLFHDLDLPVVAFEEILAKPMEVSLGYLDAFKPFKHWHDFLVMGQYPFVLEDSETFADRLGQTVRQILEVDLPSLYSIDFRTIGTLGKLLGILGHSAPYKPNISQLAEQSGVGRDTVVRHLHYLEQAGLLYLLHSSARGSASLNKPEKLYLANTSLHHTLNTQATPEVGSQRETFFLQVAKALGKKVTAPKKGDFLVDETHLFEVGGPNKTNRQLEGTDGLLVLDGIETGRPGRIPLWLFGFAY